MNWEEHLSDDEVLYKRWPPVSVRSQYDHFNIEKFQYEGVRGVRPRCHRHLRPRCGAPAQISAGHQHSWLPARSRQKVQTSWAHRLWFLPCSQLRRIRHTGEPQLSREIPKQRWLFLGGRLPCRVRGLLLLRIFPGEARGLLHTGRFQFLRPLHLGI